MSKRVTRKEYLQWRVLELEALYPTGWQEAIYSVALSHPPGWLDTIVDSETGKEITKEG